MARKEKNTGNWYIGSITDENPREFEFCLDFLKPDTRYEVTAYRDGKNAHWSENPTSVEILKSEVRKGDVIKVKLAPGGGQAIQIKCIE